MVRAALTRLQKRAVGKSMTEERIIMVLREQAIERAIAEIRAAKHTVFDGEYDNSAVYEILGEAEALLKTV